jgi:predicted subunit of tRNA(5-methylaminomethyl-2-thiouridylate) methyltransferase
MRSERFNARGQGRIAADRADAGPAQRCGRIDRCIEIVAERGAERLFKTLADIDAVDDRRPQVLGFAVDDLRDRLGFSLQTLHALFGVGQRRARVKGRAQ